MLHDNSGFPLHNDTTANEDYNDELDKLIREYDYLLYFLDNNALYLNKRRYPTGSDPYKPYRDIFKQNQKKLSEIFSKNNHITLQSYKKEFVQYRQLLSWHYLCSFHRDQCLNNKGKRIQATITDMSTKEFITRIEQFNFYTKLNEREDKLKIKINKDYLDSSEKEKDKQFIAAMRDEYIDMMKEEGMWMIGTEKQKRLQQAQFNKQKKLQQEPQQRQRVNAYYDKDRDFYKLANVIDRMNNIKTKLNKIINKRGGSKKKLKRKNKKASKKRPRKKVLY